MDHRSNGSKAAYFDLVCAFLCFKVRSFVIVIMIEGSEKRNCQGGF